MAVGDDIYTPLGSFTTKYAVDWRLRNLDTNAVLLPPYPIGEEGVTISVGGNVVIQSRFGFQDPVIQWTGGKVRTFTFQAVLYSRDRTEKVRAQLKKFEALAIKDDTLGRAPVVLFTFGKVINEIVLVENVDPQITKIRSDGEPREVTLSITMHRYKPFRQQQIDPTKPTKESYHLKASGALKTYEAIAGKYYGNPLLGDRLRKRHPDRPMLPIVGKLVKVPARDVITREVVQPAFHALSLTDAEAVGAFERIMDLRATRKVIEVI